MFHVRQAVAFRRKHNVIVRNLHERLRFSTGEKQTKKSYQIRRSSVAAAETEAAEKEAAENTNIFSDLWAWYSQKLDTHPLLTKSITGGVIAASGDILTQVGLHNPSDHKKEDGNDASFWTEVYDLKRTFRFLLLGTFYAAPTGHFWYGYLARNHAGKSFGAISWRVFLDQIIYTPVWTAVWLSSLWSMEGTPPRQLSNGLSEHFSDVMIANWILWFPAQYVNFYAVPVKYQVLFTNVVELLWNAYLSFAAAGKGEKGPHG